MHIRKFKSKMALFGDSNASIAKYLGITPQRNSAKLKSTNGAQYTQGEISMLKTRWKLTAEEVDEIFFSNTVS